MTSRGSTTSTATRLATARLQEVANALRETTRPYDICVRYGGDEFVVLLASCGRAEAEQQRRRLQDAVSAIRVRDRHGGRLCRST